VTSGLHFTGEYFEGTIRSGDRLLYSQSLISKEYIFSMVNREKDFSDVCFEIGQVDSIEPEDQSIAVRELLVRKLSQIYPESLQIVKNSNGWPVILDNGEELPIPVSFTHHGHFVAYTYHLSLTSWKAYPHHAEVL